jgi:hypothetical protein
MITFRPMKMLAARSSAVAGRTLFLSWMAAALAASFVFPAGMGAQTPLSHTEDAAPIPRGMVRFRVIPSWTRYDERFATTGLTPEDGLSADPLGAQQLPKLRPLDNAVQTLSGDSQMHLSLGRLVTHSDARVVTTPIALEYGVTRRLSIGFMVPVVQTRNVVQIDVNSKTGTPANMSFLLASARGIAHSQNVKAATSLTQAAGLLNALIIHCQATPSASDCAAYNADASGAAAARAQANALAAAAGAFGADSASTLLAPRGKGSLAIEIELQRNALNSRLQRFLGTAADSVQSLYFANGANDDFAYLDLQGSRGAPGLLQSPLGGGLDSIHTTEKLAVGDIEVGAQFLVFDRFQRDTLPSTGVQSRLMVGGSVRFATSRPDSAQDLQDIATGDGAGFELHSALDLLRGRFGSTVAARYVKHAPRTVTAALTGDPDAPGWPSFPAFGLRRRTAGDLVGVDFTPRFLVADWMALEAHYGMEHFGPTTYDADIPCATCINADGAPFLTTPSPARTAQRLGFGIRYSTVDSYERGQARYPVELSFTHLETSSGDVGLPKLTRDQIQMRLFFKVLSR